MNKQKNWLQSVLSGTGIAVAIIGVAFYGLCQIVASYLGMAHLIGAGWTITILIVCFIARWTLPITIGAFMGAMNVWGWNWFLALIFAVPGLIFAAPALVAGLTSKRGS